MKNLLLIAVIITALFASAQAQDSVKFLRKQVADDAHFLISNAADIHPNLYHDVSPEVLSRKTDSLLKALPDTVPSLMAYKTFLQITAFIGEGHTSVNTPAFVRSQFRSGRLKYVPLLITDFNNNRFEANVIGKGKELENIKVTAINGIPSQTLFSQMMQLKGGLASFKKVIAIKSFPLLAAVLGLHAPYLIEYTDKDNHQMNIQLNGVTSPEYVAAMSAGAANPAPYTFTVLKEGYGYLNFRSMEKRDRFEKFADSVFKAIDDQKIDKLVVDLRENSGGDSSLGDYLLGYLTRTPYRMAGGSELKVSQQFKTQMKTPGLNYSKPERYFSMDNGTFLKFGPNDMRKPDGRKYQYKGKVCFLTGPFTFSSANMLASTVKDYKLATLIGEPVGEPANDYGELCNISLPNTGFLAFTSTTLWIRPNGNTNDSAPVAPDYLVKAKSGAGDNVLQYSLDWLDGKK
ncbi:hypothetical protein BEL04_17220 [Mucilaginibacter sp. PPCGB 2223]|uniref:S41 family peptidase n=1 Tax=Mucilaginibacter sp. PPCGB 2223 TaxID=1886027 RepID=UPI000825D9F4|nr:S41 family peptidase [Mucilaginibacter sp. PPCGB 2223]OCX51753.1 hypothetical protein BEL04_17220 [Mucilaginibacter sp. PPCGB 2223]